VVYVGEWDGVSCPARGCVGDAHTAGEVLVDNFAKLRGQDGEGT
jgi:hypothetical protein